MDQTRGRGRAHLSPRGNPGRGGAEAADHTAGGVRCPIAGAVLRPDCRRGRDPCMAPAGGGHNRTTDREQGMDKNPLAALATVATAPMIFEPVLHSVWAKAIVIVAAYVITLTLSGKVVAYFVLPRKRAARPVADPDGPRFNTSAL